GDVTGAPLAADEQSADALGAAVQPDIESVDPAQAEDRDGPAALDVECVVAGAAIDFHAAGDVAAVDREGVSAAAGLGEATHVTVEIASFSGRQAGDRHDIRRVIPGN